MCRIGSGLGQGWKPYVGVVGLVAALFGCGSDPIPSSATATARMVAESPQELFDIRQIARETVVFDLSPDPDKVDGGWVVKGGGEIRGWAEGHLEVAASGQEDMVFTRDLGGDASDVDVIELQIRGLRPSGAVRLMWAGKKRVFSKKFSIRFGVREGVGTWVRTFRFEVGNHPDWSAKVRSIRIVLSGEHPNVRFGPITAAHLELDEEALRTAAAEPWIFDLGGRHRGVMLGLPGVPVEQVFKVPTSAELRFGVGVPPTQGESSRFTVKVRAEDGASGEEVVFEHDRSGRDHEGWTEHVVDLSTYADRVVRLVFEVEAGADFDTLRGPAMWANPVVWAPAEQRPSPNVVLISVDTLRADRMSLYGYHRDTTPGIDKWARRRGVVFETAVAPSPWTLPSHVSMLTGLHAVTHGVNHPVPAPSSLLTMAEILRSQGYATVAVTGGSYLHPRFGLAQGFEDYQSFKGDLADELDTELHAALGWIDRQADRGPFFLFFHTYEVHDPYDAREPYYSDFAGAGFDASFKDAVTRNAKGDRPDGLRNTNQFVLRSAMDGGLTEVGWEDVGLIADLYDSGVAYADEQLSLLLDRVNQPDLRRNTLVILTSDHGEALGEHHLAGHSSLYDHDILIPLIVALPDGEFGGMRVAPQVRTVDIAPTILDVVGLDPPPGMEGRSLLPFMSKDERAPRMAESYAALSNHGLAMRSGEESKYILHNVPWKVQAGHEELFDVDADPGETRNLIDRSDDAESLRRAAKQQLDLRLPGLRIVLANRSEDRCRIEFEGHGMTISNSTLKTTDLGARCRQLDVGFVRCRLKPGEELELIGERVLDQNVVIEGALLRRGVEEGTPFEMEFEIGSGEQSRTVVFHPLGGPILDGRAEDGDVSVTLRWVGDRSILGLDPSESDAELRQQLEALGYIQ